jgi:conjugative transfer signal peptidase TraF
MVLSLALSGLAALSFSDVRHPLPMLVWNASASLPIGLYRTASGVPRRGDLVLVRPPESAAILADRRGYLPAGVPLVKRIAAVGGDRVCAVDGVVFINGQIVAHQLSADRAGRPLPRWSGCKVLGGDEIFVLADAADSFDSRYFGPVPTTTIIGRLVALWTE